MEDHVNNPEVVNNTEKKRFEIVLDEGVAMLEYTVAGNNIIYTHTEVPKALEGQGLASRMAHMAMEYAKENGMKVQPLCPFVAEYVRKHPEYQGISWGY